MPRAGGGRCGTWPCVLGLMLLLGTVLLRNEPAVAAGFAIDFEGARSVGMASAGSASADDATTLFYNPAGMSFLPRNELLAGGQLFLLHDRFSDAGSTILGGAVPTPGTNGSDAIPPTFIPWLYATYRLNPTLTAGIGLFAPFGLRTDYGPHFVGRYQNQVTAITAINLNPSIAWRPVPWLSLGAGFSVQYVYARLTRGIDFGSACVDTLGFTACSGGFGLQPGRSDGWADFNGESIGFGYNLGVMLRPEAGTRISVAWRSGINQHFGSMKETFGVPAGARALLSAGGTPLAFTGSSASTDLPLPARLSFGLKQAVTDRLDVLLDATLTLWNVLQNTTITASDPVTGASAVIPQSYRNAWRFAAGAEYRLSKRWELRGGVAYDQTPITLAAEQAALPDRDRVYLSAGASFRVSDTWSFDVGYTHVIYVGDIPIDRSTSNGDTLKGSFAGGGNIVAAQLRVQDQYSELVITPDRQPEFLCSSKAIGRGPHRVRVT